LRLSPRLWKQDNIRVNSHLFFASGHGGLPQQTIIIQELLKTDINPAEQKQKAM